VKNVLDVNFLKFGLSNISVSREVSLLNHFKTKMWSSFFYLMLLDVRKRALYCGKFPGFPCLSLSYEQRVDADECGAVLE